MCSEEPKPKRCCFEKSLCIFVSVHVYICIYLCDQHVWETKHVIWKERSSKSEFTDRRQNKSNHIIIEGGPTHITPSINIYILNKINFPPQKKTRKRSKDYKYWQTFLGNKMTISLQSPRSNLKTIAILRCIMVKTSLPLSLFPLVTMCLLCVSMSLFLFCK